MIRPSSQVLLAAIAFIAAMLAAPLPVAFADTPAVPPVSTPAKVHDQDLPYYEACAREGLNASECAGRLIWFKATAGNERFHTYVFQQRVGVLIDWFRVLRSDERGDRFRAWGIINDPACCVPGSPDCPAKSLDETYGFDWCPGDEELLAHVGRSGYRDPACDFQDAPLQADDVHGPADQRHDACDLRFGTSTGALGIRKFPNPRFDRDAWAKLNGSTATWEGYNRPIAAAGGRGEAARSHLQDGAIEPPFLIGTSCGSCHIAFDPLNPPADPAHPAWENIKGLVGNQYTRVSEIMVSGMASNTLEWQMFAHARPGTSDTSAIPTDQVNNPGTINALINIAKRPTFADESVLKWRKTAACPKGADEAKCWCEPGRDGKCWEKSLQKEAVHHILKGGEDSIGALEAIQRVYCNIGSCSEQCWVNHLADLRQLDPQQRGFGQTPFDIGQCRRDCPNFRAIEDRLANILDFFMSAEGNATDLRRALKRMSAALNLLQDDIFFSLQVNGDEAGLHMQTLDPANATPVFAQETMVRVLWRLAAWLLNAPLPIRHFDFTYPEPEQQEGYNLVFPAPRRYGQVAFGFWFKTQELDTPVSRDEPALRAFLTDAYTQIISPPRAFGAVAQKVRNRLMRSYPQWPSLEEVAEHLGMTPTYFSRVFKQATGRNFIEFVNRLRISKSCELLADGDKPVTEVCFESGFNNISNFNRRFQQLKGMTPSHYRRLAVQRLTEQNLG